MLNQIDEIVYGRAVVGLALGLIVVQLVVMVIAARRGAHAPMRLKVHAIAGAALLAVPIAFGISLHAARAMMLRELSRSGDPTVKMTNISAGLYGQINAIPPAIAATGLALMLWVAGLSFTLSARRPDGHARGFPPAALIGLGLLPTAWGALQWGRAVIHTFATLGEASGDERSLIITGTLATARAELIRTASLSTAAIPILAAIACALIALRGRERDPAAPSARAPSARLLLAATAIALVAAVFLAIEARSMARENDVPWPPPSVGERFPSADPPTPGLLGPDALERAPVVQIFGNRLGLDGSEGETVASLEEKLVTLRSFHRQLHPDSFFEGAAVVLADPTTPIPRLLAVLTALRGAEYVKPVFGFTRAEVVVRPVLGRLQRVYGTGARIRLAYVDGKDDDEYEDDDDAAAWKDAVPLRPRDFPAYDAFARRLVQLRHDGKAVIVRIDRPSR